MISRFNVPAGLVLCLILVGSAQYTVVAADQFVDLHSLKSVDHRGDCRRGTPFTEGTTKVVDDDKAIEMVAHGSEYGHHCGEDQGRFAFLELKGDFDVAVQVASLGKGGARQFDDKPTPAKAGIMARESNDPGARYVAIWTVSNDGADHYLDAVHFDYRKSPNAWLGSKPKGEFVYGYVNRRVPDPKLFKREFPDVWLRLQRTGGRIAAFVSNDGKTWHATSTPAHETDFPEMLLVGVALSSAPEGHFNARSEAKFQNLTGLNQSSSAAN